MNKHVYSQLEGMYERMNQHVYSQQEGTYERMNWHVYNQQEGTYERMNQHVYNQLEIGLFSICTVWHLLKHLENPWVCLECCDKKKYRALSHFRCVRRIFLATIFFIDQSTFSGWYGQYYFGHFNFPRMFFSGTYFLGWVNQVPYVSFIFSIPPWCAIEPTSGSCLLDGSQT